MKMLLELKKRMKLIWFGISVTLCGFCCGVETSPQLLVSDAGHDQAS